jgi:uncharacterized protein YceK
MKKMLIVALVVLLGLSGCTTFRPNTQKGWAMDEINRHTRSINRLDPVIYEVNKVVLPMKAEQQKDVNAFQARFKATQQAMKARGRGE